MQRLPDDSVNRSDKNPAVQLLYFAVVSVLLAVILYFLIGMLSTLWVSRLSTQDENKWRNRMSFGASSLMQVKSHQSPELTSLLQSLLQQSPYLSFVPTVYVYCSSVPNAMAFPNGDIYVAWGLIQELNYENDLSMVLGHEVGHFVGRDHLKGVSRGLLWSAVSGVLSSSGGNRLLSQSANLLNLQFNRKQEQSSDEIGLTILNNHYGHVAGFDTFFRKVGEGSFEALKDKNVHGRISFLQTHPLPIERIETMKQMINEKGLLVRAEDRIPMSKKYQSLCKTKETADSDQDESDQGPVEGGLE